MKITRRDFLKLCGASAGALGISMTEFGRLRELLANPGGPNVLWLQGSACTGCSISFLNYVSDAAPFTAADVLIQSINLAYHPNLMALAGDSAAAELERIRQAGNYIVAFEGGVPTNFGGNACWAYTLGGKEITFQQAVSDLVSRAAAILCIGTCAAFGGIPAAPPNPTGVKSVKAATGKATINIAGCPPHPDWIVWAVVQLLLNKRISLDSYGRPMVLFGGKLHEQCPRKETDEVNTFGVDRRCLKALGCRGPETRGNCPQVLWNGKVNWCVDANAPCHGCTEPAFPGTKPFYERH